MSLASCTGVETPDVEVCAVAGVMAAGADCTTTVTDTRRGMNIKEWIEYLEPDEAAEKGAAVCFASKGFAAYKTAFEQLCAKARIHCTPKIKEQFEQTAQAVERLSYIGLRKRREFRRLEKAKVLQGN